jgi:predicted nucleic acid-binding protein
VAATGLLKAIRARTGVEFWPDAVSYADIDMSRVTGHRQVTDAYLVGLAQAHPDSRLATFDKALAAHHPADVLLVP